MKTFSINTLGCKVNQYESQQVRELLERLGLYRLESSEKTDLAIVNTCCVTHTASAKSRQYIRKIHKLYPETVIVVCGCLPTVEIGESTHTTENIHFVKKRNNLAEILSQIVTCPCVLLPEDNDTDVSSSLKTTVPERTSCHPGLSPNNIIKSEKEPKIKHKKELCNYQRLTALSSFDGQTRAFLKVQDGCDGYCTYCIVPKTRPFVRNQPPEQVLREAQALVRAGHKEIVISGIFLGAYGQKTVRRQNWPDRQNIQLAVLVDKIAQIPNLKRIRLSSLEPVDVTPQLLDIFCKHTNIMPHFHLSIQSGSDVILKKMCRQYKADQIAEKVVAIKSTLDRPAITTDIIVGFPSETDADFEQTVNLAKYICFAKMHVFRFSPRKGTAAAKMPGTVSNNVIKERSDILRKLDIELGRKFRQQFIGETAEILIEDDRNKPGGRSERYFMVNIYYSAKQRFAAKYEIQKDGSNPKFKVKNNDLVKVRLVKNNNTSMTGTIIP
ncbi:MAG: tRNA (N(6)-L-threonylcarbamoyladenosine(37)-C(2))-methylthiotransferase MtaB [Sedimentisphaerales bacterium]|nr:tRNA (N(6)-L-threonylcarbamoyladenosine(37)-C(2))-methylthiotransferase MtaB [Sedimentisphaerales bacterium]